MLRFKTNSETSSLERDGYLVEMKSLACFNNIFVNQSHKYVN